MTYKVMSTHSLNDGDPAEIEGQLSIVSALGHLNRIAKIWREGESKGEVTENFITKLGEEHNSMVTFVAESGWEFSAWIEFED